MTNKPSTKATLAQSWGELAATQVATANLMALTTMGAALSLFGTSAAKATGSKNSAAKQPRETRARATAKQKSPPPRKPNSVARKQAKSRSRQKSWYRPPTPNPIEAWMSMWGLPTARNSLNFPMPMMTPPASMAAGMSDFFQPWWLPSPASTNDGANPLDPFGLADAFTHGLSALWQPATTQPASPMDLFAAVWGLSPKGSPTPLGPIKCPKALPKMPVAFSSYQPPLNLPTPVRPWGMYVFALAIPPAMHDMIASLAVRPTPFAPFIV